MSFLDQLQDPLKQMFLTRTQGVKGTLLEKLLLKCTGLAQIARILCALEDRQLAGLSLVSNGTQVMLRYHSPKPPHPTFTIQVEAVLQDKTAAWKFLARLFGEPKPYHWKCSPADFYVCSDCGPFYRDEDNIEICDNGEEAVPTCALGDECYDTHKIDCRGCIPQCAGDNVSHFHLQTADGHLLVGVVRPNDEKKHACTAFYLPATRTVLYKACETKKDTTVLESLGDSISAMFGPRCNLVWLSRLSNDMEDKRSTFDIHADEQDTYLVCKANNGTGDVCAAIWQKGRCRFEEPAEPTELKKLQLFSKKRKLFSGLTWKEPKQPKKEPKQPKKKNQKKN